MSNYFTLTLDTIGPANPSISFVSGSYANQQLQNINIGTTDSPTTGYQMKIWGDVDVAFDTNIQATEGASTWITYSATKQIKLSTGDGNKTVYAKIRDDVNNESSIVSQLMVMDTTLPIVTIVAGPDITKISENPGKDTSQIGWQSDSIFDEYQIRYVPSLESDHLAGVLVPTTAGSVNTSGAVGNYPALTTIITTIKGTDLKTASPGSGDKLLKIFVKDKAGNWNIV